MKDLYKTVLNLENWQHRNLLSLNLQSGWPSGPRRCVQVAVQSSGRGFESLFWHSFMAFFILWFCIRLPLNFFCDILKVNQADVAEWLRRLTRNQFPSGSVGSNPTISAAFAFLFTKLHFYIMLPEIQAQCRSSHWATWCSDPMRGWLYNWARDCSATTLGLSETHAINGHCTCTVLYYKDPSTAKHFRNAFRFKF